MFKAFINKIGVFRLHCLAGLAALFLIINLATRLVLHMGFPEAHVQNQARGQVDNQKQRGQTRQAMQAEHPNNPQLP